MFWRMLAGALFRQKGKMLFIALTAALGASIASAMLGVSFDIGDKLNRELKTYGANIMVYPQGASLLGDLYGLSEDETADKYLLEAELGKIKTIFWAFNIVDFSPFFSTKATINGNGNAETVRVEGAWYNHHLALPTGEETDAGLISMKNWWDVDGGWPEHDGEVIAGAEAARRFGLVPGDVVTLEGVEAARTFTVKGVFSSGGDEDEAIFTTLASAQALAGKGGRVSRIEVSALTTPDNELSRRASVNPQGLSIKEWEQWYCTAYVSAICYQIDEVLTGSISKPVRRVSESEGAILEKTTLLMVLITALSLAGAALGISNLVTASVLERSAEIGLFKALGATEAQVIGLVTAGVVAASLAGGVPGFLAGCGFAKIIGQSVFNSSITIRAAVIPLVTLLVLLMTLAGCLPAMRSLVKLRPTETLHGR
ncbi:MAG: ABC transporter permease [Spirochaetaceae bacterium]|jgi:putative ABC transport system permease protein|nr:ABC transporter permease [Spirochaetaceae bacterium]